MSLFPKSDGGIVAALEAKIAGLEVANEELSWQVQNWERKEIDRAKCCMTNQRAAKNWKELAKLLRIESRMGQTRADNYKAWMKEYESKVESVFGMLVEKSQELRDAYENLTDVQTRCTELLLSNRFLTEELVAAKAELARAMAVVNAELRSRTPNEDDWKRACDDIDTALEYFETKAPSTPSDFGQLADRLQTGFAEGDDE